MKDRMFASRLLISLACLVYLLLVATDLSNAKRNRSKGLAQHQGPLPQYGQPFAYLQPALVHVPVIGSHIGAPLPISTSFVNVDQRIGAQRRVPSPVEERQLLRGNPDFAKNEAIPLQAHDQDQPHFQPIFNPNQQLLQQIDTGSRQVQTCGSGQANADCCSQVEAMSKQMNVLQQQLNNVLSQLADIKEMLLTGHSTQGLSNLIRNSVDHSSRSDGEMNNGDDISSPTSNSVGIDEQITTAPPEDNESNSESPDVSLPLMQGYQQGEQSETESSPELSNNLTGEATVSKNPLIESDEISEQGESPTTKVVLDGEPRVSMDQVVIGVARPTISSATGDHTITPESAQLPDELDTTIFDSSKASTPKPDIEKSDSKTLLPYLARAEDERTRQTLSQDPVSNQEVPLTESRHELPITLQPAEPEPEKTLRAKPIELANSNEAGLSSRDTPIGQVFVAEHEQTYDDWAQKIRRSAMNTNEEAKRLPESQIQESNPISSIESPVQQSNLANETLRTNEKPTIKIPDLSSIPAAVSRVIGNLVGPEQRAAPQEPAKSFELGSQQVESLHPNDQIPQQTTISSVSPVTTPAPPVTTSAPLAVTFAPQITTPAGQVISPAPIITTPAPLLTTTMPTVSTPAPEATTYVPLVTSPASSEVQVSIESSPKILEPAQVLPVNQKINPGETVDETLKVDERQPAIHNQVEKAVENNVGQNLSPETSEIHEQEFANIRQQQVPSKYLQMVEPKPISDTFEPKQSEQFQMDSSLVELPSLKKWDHKENNNKLTNSKIDPNASARYAAQNIGAKTTPGIQVLPTPGTIEMKPVVERGFFARFGPPKNSPIPLGSPPTPVAQGQPESRLNLKLYNDAKTDTIIRPQANNEPRAQISPVETFGPITMAQSSIQAAESQQAVHYELPSRGQKRKRVQMDTLPSRGSSVSRIKEQNGKRVLKLRKRVSLAKNKLDQISKRSLKTLEHKWDEGREHLTHLADRIVDKVGLDQHPDHHQHYHENIEAEKLQAQLAQNVASSAYARSGINGAEAQASLNGPFPGQNIVHPIEPIISIPYQRTIPDRTGRLPQLPVIPLESAQQANGQAKLDGMTSIASSSHMASSLSSHNSANSRRLTRSQTWSSSHSSRSFH